MKMTAGLYEMFADIYLHILVCMIAIRPLLLFKVPQPLIVSFDLIPKKGIFVGSTFSVQLETTSSIQTLQVQPSSPYDANSIHDEAGHQMNLTGEKITVIKTLSCYATLAIC